MAGLTLVVPWAGPVSTVTEAGSRGAPPGVTVSLVSTLVVTGVFGAVLSVSAPAVTLFAGTVMDTVADEQTGVGFEVSHAV